jgi:hypothetical protein
LSTNKETVTITDGKVTNTVMINNYKEYDMSSIKVPVLIIHAEDYKLSGNPGLIHKWAETIPKSTSLFLEHGGHLISGNSSLIDKTVDEFISATTE